MSAAAPPRSSSPHCCAAPPTWPGAPSPSPSSPPPPGSCWSCPLRPVRPRIQRPRCRAHAHPRRRRQRHRCPGRHAPHTPPRRTGDHPGQPGRRRGRPRKDHLTRRVTARRAHPGRPYPAARLRARRNIAPLFPTILAGITPTEADSASGSLGAIQQLAGSIGVATIATLYTATSHPAGRGLVITALATVGVLVTGAVLTLSCHQPAAPTTATSPQRADASNGRHPAGQHTPEAIQQLREMPTSRHNKAGSHATEMTTIRHGDDNFAESLQGKSRRENNSRDFRAQPRPFTTCLVPGIYL